MRLREFVNRMGLPEIYDREPAGRLMYEDDGWATDEDVLRDLVREVSATDIIELGAWKGGSARVMAESACKLSAGAPTVLCVDTWLGSQEHIDGAYGSYVNIRPHGSRLPLLRQFIMNMRYQALCGVVFPFPSTTSGAAAVLRRLNVQIDLVYVDASHEYGDVRRDLHDYWPIVRPGGVLVGDDYAPEWPGVVDAVRRFQTYGVGKPEIRGRKYIFRKSPVRSVDESTIEAAAEAGP